jgi:DNA-binding FrmR family transcriptional regulator
MSHQHKHGQACHMSEMPKLNRISGQIDGIKRMVEEDRQCTDILTQLRAVRAAIKSVEANILENHLHSCVRDALSHSDEEMVADKIAELKDLFKRFEA